MKHIVTSHAAQCGHDSALGMSILTKQPLPAEITFA